MRVRSIFALVVLLGFSCKPVSQTNSELQNSEQYREMSLHAPKVESLLEKYAVKMAEKRLDVEIIENIDLKKAGYEILDKNSDTYFSCLEAVDDKMGIFYTFLEVGLMEVSLSADAETKREFFSLFRRKRWKSKNIVCDFSGVNRTIYSERLFISGDGKYNLLIRVHNTQELKQRK